MRTTIYPDKKFHNKVKAKSITNISLDSATAIYCEGAKRLLNKSVERRAQFIMVDYNKYLSVRFGKQIMIEEPIWKMEMEEIQEHFNDWFKEMIDIDNEYVSFIKWISDKNE